MVSGGGVWSHADAAAAAGVEIRRQRDICCHLLLMVLTSEIKPSNSATFHNIQSPNIAIGLIANHVHEFW